MNINKNLKPNLVDPKYRIKISKTLNPPKPDYWKPTKNVFQLIYSDYIWPNIWFFICVFVIILLLLYRYRTIQNQKLEERFRATSNINPISKEDEIINILSNNDIRNVNYSDIAINAYTQQKEKSAEPRININKNTNRINWAIVSETNQPGLAYPIFPNVKGGSLLPSTPKRS